jgi:hypothetical protein
VLNFLELSAYGSSSSSSLSENVAILDLAAFSGFSANDIYFAPPGGFDGKGFGFSLSTGLNVSSSSSSSKKSSFALAAAVSKLDEPKPPVALVASGPFTS